NTATPEVMRALPHGYKLVHETASPSFNPRVGLAEAIVHYRERFNGLSPATNPGASGIPGGANYTDRSDNALLDDLRGERGFASIGELLLLVKDAQAPIPEPTGETLQTQAWNVAFAANDPFGNGDSTRISTDVQGVFTSTLTLDDPDEVAQDVEEANLLFAGISNLITTRSDMFTVHFIVRSFRQNPITGIWDATDREQIVDERRYVMLVDRSEVNRPTDRPRILYLEKLPN
ncbi:MAG: hypothetical protein IIB54_15305, partial [Planctomycetes bacterium]|nr:hypothetical protein [Planctomycetota bacterium]